MRTRWLMALLVLLQEAWSTRRDAQIRFLKLQVEMLQSRLPGNRVIPDPLERRRLMKIGAEMEHAVEHTLGIVSIKTYRRWLREERGSREPRKVGRPRLTKSLCELILRLARENVGWGVRRIVGELRKLALTPSRSSVRRVLADEKILPDPDRHAPKGVLTPWRKFLAIHMNVMVACDFFCYALQQLDRVVQTYAYYYNEYRPHQGLGNRPLGAREGLTLQTDEIEAGSILCKHWLGGLLKHYYRKAA